MDFFPLVKQIYGKLPNITSDEVKDMQRAFAKENKMKDLPSKSQILHAYFNAINEWKIEKNQTFETLLRKRAIRSLSGIVPVQVLTKPRPCPWKCIFCPNEPEMPKSYIKSEPGAMRAWLNQFDPLKQVYNRLQSLTSTGHQTDKIEMIVLWWSRDAYPRDYKIDFIKNLYDACNTFSDLKIWKWNQNNSFWESENPESKYHFEILNQDQIVYSNSLEEAIKRNETAQHRIIWLTIETRPDLVKHTNCKFWRELWVTRVEMWIQSTDDEILQLNKRWHTVKQIENAMHIMRQYWFKISIHLMPWLYGSNIEKDIQSFKTVFTNPAFQPDELKFYPTSVIPNTELYDLYKDWKYQPITTDRILQVIRETFLYIIPPYTRIKRLIRDIPATEITAGSNVTNLSQIAHDSLLKEMKNWLFENENWNLNKNDVLNFYSRIYWNFELFEKEEQYLANIKNITKKTVIIWKNPDLLSFRHFVCLDTRSREIRNRVEKKENSDLNLIIREYESSAWIERFISFEDELGYLHWFTRLMLPNEESISWIEGLEKWTAIIRELHVYWELQKIWWKNDSATQHTWLWRRLLSIAEKISKEFWYTQFSVISWVWVRKYYEGLCFELKGTYMSKLLNNI